MSRRAARRNCPPGQPRHSGEVQSVLFDGANSAVLLQEARTRREFRIALPQTGQFSDLKPHENSRCSVSIRRAPCVFPRAPARRDRMLSAMDARWQGRLRSACCWLRRCSGCGALIVLPHVDLAVLSFRERVGPRQYVASLAQYKTFFTEPLYWHVFVRTAVMSVLATLLTLLLAFPIAWIIAKLARGPCGLAAVHHLPDPLLGQRDGAHPRLDDPAARVRRAARACW